MKAIVIAYIVTMLASFTAIFFNDTMTESVGVGMLLGCTTWLVMTHRKGVKR